jgi:hypothetical protein
MVDARVKREKLAAKLAIELQAAETERESHMVRVDSRVLAKLARAGAAAKAKKAKPKPDHLDDDVIDDGRDDDARQALPQLPQLSHVEGFYDPGPVPFVFGATKGLSR